jgi:ActR/RegA family two-component response regulator
MHKSTPRLLVAVQDGQVWRSLSRIAGASHEIVRVSLEADVQEQLRLPTSVVIVEPLVGSMSGLKILDRARDVQPQAQRVVVSNFSEIALLIEGVHSGLVQRVLGFPIAEAEVRALLSSNRGAMTPALPAQLITGQALAAAR